MQVHIPRPVKHQSNRENSADPAPCNVKIKVHTSGGDVFIDVPSDIDPAYMQNVLSTVIQGLQCDNGGNQNNGTGCIIDSADHKEYDIFVSHASEDVNLVENLVSHLEALGIHVWYDKQKITWGDSLRESMEEGVRKARYGIVILSPDFIKKGKYWTKAELDAFFQLESATGKKFLLPIWHNVGQHQVFTYSPFVASRKALNTAQKNTAEIAIEVAKFIRTGK